MSKIFYRKIHLVNTVLVDRARRRLLPCLNNIPFLPQRRKCFRKERKCIIV